MKRYDFLRLCGGMLLATQIPDRVLAQLNATDDDAVELKTVRRLTISVGATKPFKALHLSDTHLTRVDSRDDERKHKLAATRTKYFPMAEQYFDAAIRYAATNNLMLLHTGDLQDFVSYANLDCIASKLGADKWFTAAGNHEYSQYVGEAREDEAYRAQTYDRVQAAFPNNLTVASRVINGVNFVALDNGYYKVSAEQYEAMRREVAKGLPIVLMCHVPFYTPEHCKVILKTNGGVAGYMTGVPLSITETYQQDPSLPADEQWRNRTVQQRADQTTLDFVEWLKEQPLLKAILCGHLHVFYEERFSPTAIQYTVESGFTGGVHEIQFV